MLVPGVEKAMHVLPLTEVEGGFGAEEERLGQPILPLRALFLLGVRQGRSRGCSSGSSSGRGGEESVFEAGGFGE